MCNKINRSFHLTISVDSIIYSVALFLSSFQLSPFSLDVLLTHDQIIIFWSVHLPKYFFFLAFV